MDEWVFRNVLIGVLTAVGEQLDIERLLEALGRQHVIARRAEHIDARAPQVAQLLREIGTDLARIRALREKRHAPKH